MVQHSDFIVRFVSLVLFRYFACACGFCLTTSLAGVTGRHARGNRLRAQTFTRGGATAARRLQKSAGEETTRRARESRDGSKLTEENLGS